MIYGDLLVFDGDLKVILRWFVVIYGDLLVFYGDFMVI